MALIATNLFQQYALSLLLTQANLVGEKWGLQLTTPISTNNITEFSARLRRDGLSGGIVVDDRYLFGISRGRFESFKDLRFYANSFVGKPDRERELLSMTNLLTKKTALAVARGALHKLGLDEKSLRLREPPVINQWKWQPPGEKKTHSLPLFDIEWKYQAQDMMSISMEISGITRNVASYFNNCVFTLAIPGLTNYQKIISRIVAEDEEAGNGNRDRARVRSLASAQQGLPSKGRHYWETNITMHPRAYPGNRFGYVPTNTVAFQKYAFDLLLTLANDLNVKWQLGIASPIDAERVTSFVARPKTNSIDCSLGVDNRYGFRFAEGRLELFRDLEYWRGVYEGNPKLYQERGRQPDKLSKKAALKAAHLALRNIGLDEDTLKISKRPELIQWEYKSDGKSQNSSFPHYDVKWKFGYPTEASWSAPIFMEISGITGRIAAYGNSCVTTTPRVPLPTNYWQLLGVLPSGKDAPAD